MPTEHFTRALQLTHSFDPASVSSHERLEAERYLMDLRESPEGLNLSFHIISNEAVDEVRCFWAFNTIMCHLPALGAVAPQSSASTTASSGSLSSSTQPGTAAVDDAQAEELYRTLFSFIFRYLFTPQQPQQPQQLQGFAAAAGATGQGVAPISDFLLNKHAQLMVVGLQCFYPNRWRSFFDDLFDLLDRSSAHPPTADAVAMYFLRIFEYIDERVVSVRDRTLQERGKDVRVRDMAVKDGMREQVIPRLVSTWFALLSEVRVRAPELAFLCLSVAQTYIDWIDVNLVMTAEWINLLYFMMTVPPTSLRVAACECILSLVVKKQLPGLKMESLRVLSVVSSLPRIVAMLTVPPRSEDDVALIDAVARLTAAVAEQFLQLVETCSSGTRPPSSVPIAPEIGLNMTDIPFDITPQLITSLEDALHAVVAQLLRIYDIPSLPETHEVLLPFLQMYIRSRVLTEEEAVGILLSTFDHTRIVDLARGQEDKVWDDSTVDRRKQLFQIVRLLHRQHPHLVLNHLHAVVEGVVEERGPSIYSEGASSGSLRGDVSRAADSSAHPPAQSPSPRPTSGALAHIDFRQPDVVEAALHYFFEIGKALRLESCLRDPSDPVAVMVARLLTCDAVAVHQAHPCVHLVFFECLERFHLFFVYRAEYVPVLLQRLLLLPCGVMNPHDRVRGRICYVLSRMVQLLKSSLRPYAVDMVHAITVIVGKTVESATSGDGNSGWAANRAGQRRRTGLLLLPNDQRELYEATGTLLSLLLPSVSSSAGSTTAAAAAAAAVPIEDTSLLGSESSGLPRAQLALSSPATNQAGDSNQGNKSSSADPSEEAAYCVTLAQAVIEGVLRHLQAVSNSDGGGDGSISGHSNTNSSNSDNLDGRRVAASVETAVRGAGVADAMSYLSALAKGLSLSDVLGNSSSSSSNTNSSNSGGDGANLNALTASCGQGQRQNDSAGRGVGTPLSPELRPALRIAALFSAVTEQHIMQLLNSPWRASLAVRDAGCQFLQQMVNTAPFELIAPLFEPYVELALESMESVPELSRLLRLMYQFVNKSGSRAIPVASRITPMAWSKLFTLGELSSASSPVVYLGVVSESAREKADAYRQFFAYLFSVAAWGCAVSFLLMPEDCILSILQQLIDAAMLPADIELPRAAIQTLTKLISELLGSTSPAGGNAGGGAVTNTAALSKAEQLLTGFPGAAAQLSRALSLLQHIVLTEALPTVMRAVLRAAPPRQLVGQAGGAVGDSSVAVAADAGGASASGTGTSQVAPTGPQFFDLSDGKSVLLLGEVGALCKTCTSTTFSADALRVIFQSLIAGGVIEAEEAMEFCCAVRDQPRFTSALKAEFRRMLERAQQRRAMQLQ